MNSLLKLKFSAIGFIALSTFSLASCASKTPHIVPYNMMEMNTRLSATQQHVLLGLIRHCGVHVIQQGSRLQMVLPTDRFFVPTTTLIKENKAPTLREIALYLHNFVRIHHTKYPLKVYGYTDKVYKRKVRHYYSNQYAQVIAAFMWRHGFRPGQMSVVGYGAHHPIANTRTTAGNAYNRRVVIQVN